MPDVERPRAREGTLCPLFKKDVSRVCHKCELFDSVRVYKVENGRPVEFDQWGCTFKLTRLVARDLGQAVHEMGAAVESARNQSAKDSDRTFTALIEVARDMRDTSAALALSQTAIGAFIASNLARGAASPALAAPAK